MWSLLRGYCDVISSCDQLIKGQFKNLINAAETNYNDPDDSLAKRTCFRVAQESGVLEFVNERFKYRDDLDEFADNVSEGLRILSQRFEVVENNMFAENPLNIPNNGRAPMSKILGAFSSAVDIYKVKAPHALSNILAIFSTHMRDMANAILAKSFENPDMNENIRSSFVSKINNMNLNHSTVKLSSNPNPNEVRKVRALKAELSEVLISESSLFKNLVDLPAGDIETGKNPFTTIKPILIPNVLPINISNISPPLLAINPKQHANPVICKGSASTNYANEDFSLTAPQEKRSITSLIYSRITPFILWVLRTLIKITSTPLRAIRWFVFQINSLFG